MPIEAKLLRVKPPVYFNCPNCQVLFEEMMRGLVQRAKRPWYKFGRGHIRPYCAVICRECKEVVGWEKP